MIANNKEYDICETFDLNDSSEIILINIHKIKNISSMLDHAIHYCLYQV